MFDIDCRLPTDKVKNYIDGKLGDEGFDSTDEFLAKWQKKEKKIEQFIKSNKPKRAEPLQKRLEAYKTIKIAIEIYRIKSMFHVSKEIRESISTELSKEEYDDLESFYEKLHKANVKVNEIRQSGKVESDKFKHAEQLLNKLIKIHENFFKAIESDKTESDQKIFKGPPSESQKIESVRSTVSNQNLVGTLSNITAQVSDPRLTLFSDKSERTPRVINYQGQRYLRHAVDPDGDCGYTAFGIIREEAYKLISEHLHAVRDVLKGLVQEVLCTDANFIEHIPEDSTAVKEAYRSYCDALQKKDPKLEDYERNLKQHGDDLNLLSCYLDYDIKDKHVDAGWAHPLILFALAHIQKIHLCLWELNERGEMVQHRHYPEYHPQDVDGESTDLLFVNGNHFERLEKLALTQLSEHSSVNGQADVLLAGRSQNPDILEFKDIPLLNITISSEVVPLLNEKIPAPDVLFSDCDLAEQASEETDVRYKDLAQGYLRLFKMPDCAEKSVAILELHFRNERETKKNMKKLKPHQVLEKAPKKIIILTQDHIKFIFEKLVVQLQEEDLIKDSSIKKLLDEVKFILDKENEIKLSSISNLLSDLLSKIRPINIDFVLELINKTQSAAFKIKDEQIILLIGLTGAGKSTTIHFLGGSKLQKTKQNGQRHIAPIQLGSDDLKSVSTSNLPRSETRNINPVKVDVAKLGSKYSGNIVLCDSPGFGDTRSTEIDIVNGICLVNAIKETASVKLVLLISNHSLGEKAQHLVGLTDTLVSFVPSIREHFESIFYVFTKYGKDEREEIKNFFKNKSKELNGEEKLNEGLKLILKDLIQKTQEKPQGESDTYALKAVLLDPINDKPGDVLDMLHEMPPITNPRETFNEYITPNSLNKLKECLVIYERSFSWAITALNVSFALYKFGQIKALKEKLQLPEIERTYQRIHKTAIDFFENIQSNIKQKFIRMGEDRNFSINLDLQQSVNLITMLVRMEEFRKTYIQNYPNLIEVALKNIFNLQKKLNSSITDALQKNKINSEFFHNFEKLKAITEVFGPIFTSNVDDKNAVEKNYTVMRDHIFEYVNNTFESAKLAFDERRLSDFVNLADLLSEIGKYSKQHPNIFGPDVYINITEKVDKYLDFLFQEIEMGLNRNCDSSTVFSDFLPHLKDPKYIVEVADSLVKIIHTPGIKRHSTFDRATKRYESIQRHIANFFADIAKKFITSVIEQNAVAKLNEFKAVIDYLDVLRQDNLIRGISNTCYFEAINKIKMYVRKFQQIASQNLDVLNNNEIGTPIQVNYKAIETAARALKSLKAFVDHPEKIYEDDVQVSASIEDYIKKIELKVSAVDLRLENNHEYPMCLLALDSLYKISTIELLIFEQAPQCPRIIGLIESKINLVLAEIVPVIEQSRLFENPKLYARIYEFLGNQIDEKLVPSELAQKIRKITENFMSTRQKWNSEMRARLATFEQLMQSKEIATTKLILQEIDIIIKHLLFINALTLENSVNFKSLNDNILSKWFAAGGIFASHISKLLTYNKSIVAGKYGDEVYDIVRLVHKLKALDKCMLGLECQYGILCVQLEESLKAQHKNKIAELRFLSSQKDFSKFADEYKMITPVQADLLIQASEVLKNLIDTVYQDSQKLKVSVSGLNLAQQSTEVSVQIIKEAEKLSQSKVINELRHAESYKAVTSNLSAISIDLQDKIQLFVASILKYIDNEEVDIAYEKLNIYRTIETLAGNSQIFKVIPTEIENRLIQKLSIIQKKYALLKGNILKYYDASPKLYIERLGKLNAYDEKKFSPYYIQTKNIIINNIKELIQNCSGENCRLDVEDVVQKIKGLHIYLPADVYAAFSEEVDKLEFELKQRYDQDLLLLNQLKESNDLKKLVNTLLDYLSKCRYKEAKKCNGYIIEQIHKEFDYFLKEIAKNNVGQILSVISKALSEWRYYHQEITKKVLYQDDSTWWGATKEAVKETVKGVLRIKSEPLYCDPKYPEFIDKRVPDKLSRELIGAILTDYAKMLREISSVKAASSMIHVFEIFSRYFDNLKGLFELFVETGRDNDSLYSRLTSYNLQLKFAKVEDFGVLDIFHLIETFLVDVNKKFEATICSSDLSSLNEIMNAMSNHDKFLHDVKEFSNQESVKTSLGSFSRNVLVCQSYREMKKKLSLRLIELQNTACQKILEHTRAKSSNCLDRKVFYHEISEANITLKSIDKLHEQHVERTVNLTELKNIARTTIIKHLDEVATELFELTKRLPSEESKNYSEINIWYDNLRIAEESLNDENISQHVRIMLKKIESHLGEKFQDFQKMMLQFKLPQDDDKFIINLIYIKLMVVYAPSFKAKVDALIDLILKEIKAKYGSKTIALLGQKFNKFSDQHRSIAHMIISEHAVFKSYSVELRNEKTLRQDIHYVLDKMFKDQKNTEFNKDRLKECFDQYEELYWERVESGGLEDIQKIKKQLIQQIKSISVDTSLSYDARLVKLVAYLFAYWTLLNSTTFSDADEKKERSAILQPHSAQVVSIFRLLGLDSHTKKAGDESTQSSPDETQWLQNHLVQIGTGEGKSVTMAITASVLAFLGYDVDCACYSDYLSQRDQDDFSTFFSDLGLSRRIHYGTFNKLCENLINQNGDVRERMVNMIDTAHPSYASDAEYRRQKIILIDEVDVFFSADFYGNFYRPLAELRDPTIDKLINYIWENRADKKLLSLNSIKKSGVYLDCCSRYKGWEFLVEESVKALIVDLLGFEDHEYVVQNEKIGYREQHGISFEISYRYKTTFAYFCEYNKGNVTKSTLNSHVAFLIDCGVFSYAEIPKQYAYIMGVTGTLETLSSPEKSLLKTIYEINKFSYMPSVYGNYNLDFLKDSPKYVKTVDESNYNYVLASEIKDRLQAGAGIQRPVMVFFETNSQLMGFYNSSQLPKAIPEKEEHVRLITEEVRDDQKEGLIRQATSEGIVTLLTRGFGRGTDFRCYDERINTAGGVHVIQTFVSDVLSEETQIKGRTARQGDPGSYSMVLLDQPLERYGLREQEIRRMNDTGSFYSTISEARDKFFSVQYQESLRYVDSIEKDHKDSMQFLRSLFSDDIKEVKEFILKRNKTLLADTHVKTLCLMDATGSMSSLLTKSKNSVHLMFSRVCEILQKDPRYSNIIFQLQFVVYRNYSSEGKLLEHSDWESDPSNLRQFMDTISTSGGQGNEAIEIGFWYANREAEKDKVSQIILIGDMPPNTREEVVTRRASNSDYWKHTQDFSCPVYADEQAALLIEKEIPIHGFYVKNDAKEYFEKVAAKSGGKSGFLDINSPQGAEHLTNVVCERILDSIGGEELVKEYQKVFKGYVSVGKNQASFFASSVVNDNNNTSQSSAAIQSEIVSQTTHFSAKKNK